jgi:hypothetical protein
MTDSIYKRGGERYHSKKELLIAVKEGEIPILESTSPFNNYPSKPINQLTPGHYSIVGPEPYDRRWYAEITVKPGGRFSVR